MLIGAALDIYLFIYLLINLFIYLFIHLFILFIYLFYLFIYLLKFNYTDMARLNCQTHLTSVCLIN